jgi:hypothetical protein
MLGVDVLKLTDLVSAAFAYLATLWRKQGSFFASRPFIGERVSDKWLARHRDE